MTSIDENIHNEAKKLRLNISEILEDALIRKCRQISLEDNGEFPEELAFEFPDKYCISPNGKCKKRGDEQFLINHMGNVVETDKNVYKAIRKQKAII